jgi:ABC-2 type transport system permease protein
MQTLLTLTVANLRSFTRDRAALFWTLAFPIMFVILFGTIFAGGGSISFKVGWVDQDGTPASAQLRAAFGATKVFELTDGALDPMLERMRTGDVNAVIVVPRGLGGVVVDPSSAAGGALALDLYIDPSQTTQSQTISQLVGQVVAATNLAISGTPPALTVASRAVQTQTLNGAAYYVPSILAMALMQLGIFSAIPLVEQRTKKILKRLSATPLRRWNLVGSNILMRLTIAVLQAVLIIGIGVAVLGVTIVGSILAVAGFVILGAVTFISIGYVIASFARTEEAANGMTSVVQFPLMFLSGIFFPIALMPAFLQPVAALLPLTYLADALRQVMAGGVPYAPLWADALILAVWLVASFLVSARYFRWE